jgi:murein DD-endopeptidase MepM/ murein hydrolase activator NlpD
VSVHIAARGMPGSGEGHVAETSGIDRVPEPAVPKRPRARATGYRSVTVGLVALLAMLVTLSTGLPPSGSAAAAPDDLAIRLAASRSSLRALESSMLARDRAVISLQRERARARRQARQFPKRIKAAAAQRRDARIATRAMKTRLSRAQEAVDRALEQVDRDDPSERAIERLERVERAARQLERSVKRLELAADRRERDERAVRRQQRAHRAKVVRLGQRLRAAIGSRSATEGMLAATIRTATSLARQRAALRTAGGTTQGRIDFDWPTRPRITQGYGCTGFRLEPRRGSCPHFHDGIDFGGRYGSPIKAAADGVVAYVGWSPLGGGDRAFIIVMGHPGGFETLYGHLLPVRRVRVGQYVEKGRTIGLMGNTGRSTGTHLHWEISRDFRTLDPRGLVEPPARPERPPAEAEEAGPGDEGEPMPAALGDAGDEAALPGAWWHFDVRTGTGAAIVPAGTSADAYAPGAVLRCPVTLEAWGAYAQPCAAFE